MGNHLGSAEQTEEWFRITAFGSDVYAIEEPLHREQVASFLIVGSERALLLDTGMGVAPLRPVVVAVTDRPVTVLLSHAHFDHIGGTSEFAETSPILIHAVDAPRLRKGLGPADLERFYQLDSLLGPLPSGFDPTMASIPGVEPTDILRGGELIDLGDRQLEVLFCPGHAAGLVALLDREQRVLFSTDVVYEGALYAHMQESDVAGYGDTLARLASLEPELDWLYPSHNRRPIPASYLAPMAAAMAEVVTGRLPDEAVPDRHIHQFDGFSILVPAADR